MIRQYFNDKNNKKDFKFSYEKRANEAKQKKYKDKNKKENKKDEEDAS